MTRKATGKFYKLGQSNKDTTGPIDLRILAGSELSLDCLSYGPDTFSDTSLKTIPELNQAIQANPVTWINVKNTTDTSSLQPLVDFFNLHELAIEDALKFHQRSKVDTYGDHLFIVMRVPSTKDASKIDTEQLALFLGKNYVISFQEQDGGASLEAVRERIRKDVGTIRKRGADYLAYVIIDLGIDAFFPILEEIGEKIETLEEKIISESPEKIPPNIHSLKLEILAVRRSVWPMRDSINSLCRDVSPYIGENTRFYFRDCYDHLSRIIDLVEMYRELSTDLLNIHLSSVNNRMNEIIKVLTIITTLFIPPTMIAGIYGMNFKPEKSPFNMPELSWYYGYPLALFLMMLTSGAVLIFLRHRKWL